MSLLQPRDDPAPRSEWREHVAGPPGPVQFCARCMTVIRLNPPSSIPAFPEGHRVKGDGSRFSLVGGWPYTKCEPWEPQVGDHLTRPASTGTGERS